ncbi:trypsin-like serine protease [Nonomuraea phyllanthi]|uniref:Trypsin-like serine protease n=1 Tax=Nonomuraea phyllanthi TaxID=2219224 RepID=A0A5C4WI75_9ACTN|nr:trypsin-like serine protease [Nonomuraea phyllanthi]KAB8193802.1 trypsin-like serine protease [Nonomuraea phyllanthi]QFY12542.1 trypsin-like serine protease [Nonomuraea phyllanthi]
MIPPARHLAAAALCGVLLVLSAFTGIASAGRDSVVYAVTLTKTAADVKRVADYWKPDQLKRSDSYSPATPGPAAPVASPSPSSSGPPAHQVTSPVTRAVAAQAVAPALPRKGPAASTMGKVFFRFGDKEFWCSASAVAAKNHSVVATAGHCAYDPRQARAAEDWIFVPNPGPNGETPQGIYVGASISMHEDWTGKGDYDYDYAFVTVHRGFKWVAKNGGYVMEDVGRLQDNVGGQGIEFNQKPPEYTVSAFGYPAGPQPDGTRPFNGKKLRMCGAGTTRWTWAVNLDLQKGVQLLSCDFSPGVSGGPWLIGYNEDRGLGNLNGVNSLTWDRDAEKSYDAVSSPYFDTTTGEVYRRAAAQATPANVT